MTLSELGSLGEFIGSVAVLVTLAYLAVQVRLARSDSAAAALRNRGEAMRAVMIAQVTDTSLVEAHLKADSAVGHPTYKQLPIFEEAGLSAVESFKITQWYALIMHTYMTQYDSMNSDQRRMLDGGIRMNFAVGVGRALWDADLSARFDALSPRFAGYVADLLAKHDDGQPRSP